MSNQSIDTKYIKINPEHPDPAPLEEAGLIIRQGGLVAFPTETVYGLGANAMDGKASAKIFKAKGRPSDNPLIVHVADKGDVKHLARHIPDSAKILMDIFWPGPLTLVLPSREDVPHEVTAGLTTVAVRIPDHQVALALIKAAGVPIAAPSANLSGRPSTTTAEHVLEDMNGRIDAILDGGPSGVGVESTVLDVTTPVPMVLRPGGVTLEDLKDILGILKIDPACSHGGDKPRAPGMKYTHYAPKAPLILVEGDPPAAVQKILELAEEQKAMGRRVGILAFSENSKLHSLNDVVLAGCRERPETVALDLFASLRRFDRMNVELILAEGIEERGMGLAVMNRLRKAAGGKIFHV